MSASEFMTNLFDSWPAWVVGGALSLGAALVDLQSATRWPYLIAAFGIALFLSLWRPNWVWRWTLLVTFVLPTFVLLSNIWGPYAVDRFDVFYGILPAALGTLASTPLRSTIKWHGHSLL